MLSSTSTPGNIHDCPKLLTMLVIIKNLGFDFKGHIFNADRGYDANYNFEDIFWMGMMPNIKQRAGAVNKDNPDRKKAAGMFDRAIYTLRSLMGGIFGAEETSGTICTAGSLEKTTGAGSARAGQSSGTYVSSTGLSVPKNWEYRYPPMAVQQRSGVHDQVLLGGPSRGSTP